MCNHTRPSGFSHYSSKILPLSVKLFSTSCAHSLHLKYKDTAKSLLQVFYLTGCSFISLICATGWLASECPGEQKRNVSCVIMCWVRESCLVRGRSQWFMQSLVFLQFPHTAVCWWALSSHQRERLYLSHNLKQMFGFILRVLKIYLSLHAFEFGKGSGWFGCCKPSEGFGHGVGLWAEGIEHSKIAHQGELSPHCHIGLSHLDLEISLRCCEFALKEAGPGDSSLPLGVILGIPLDVGSNCEFAIGEQVLEIPASHWEWFQPSQLQGTLLSWRHEQGRVLVRVCDSVLSPGGIVGVFCEGPRVEFGWFLWVSSSSGYSDSAFPWVISQVMFSHQWLT